MPRKAEPADVSGVAKRIRDELGEAGYTLRFSTERVDDENLLARLEIVNNETHQAYGKIVGVGKIMNMDMALGFHLSEEIMSDLVSKGLAFLNSLRVLVPRGAGETESQVRVEERRG